MSAVQKLDPERSSRTTLPPRPLTPVPETAPPLRRLPFAALLVAILGVGMLGLLVLNTSLQDQSFRLSELQAQATRLAYDEDALRHELDLVSSPSALVSRATELGMRPSVAPAFIVLPDGKVVGDPKAATGKDFKSALIKSPAQLEAERKAAEAKKRAEEAKKRAEEQRKADEKREAEEKRKAAEDEKKSDEKKEED